MVREPFADGPVLVGGVVVEDGVDGQPGGRRVVDLVEELDELPAPVALGMAPDGLPVQDVQGCEQVRGAVPLAVAGH